MLPVDTETVPSLYILCLRQCYTNQCYTNEIPDSLSIHYINSLYGAKKNALPLHHRCTKWTSWQTDCSTI